MSGDVTPKCVIPWEIHILSGCSKLKISYKLTRNPRTNRRFMSGSVVYKWGGLVRTWEPTQTFYSISSPALVKMKDANLELLNPQSNADSFLALSMNPWSGNSKSHQSLLQSVDIIPKTMCFFIFLRFFFPGVGDILVFLFSTKNPVKTHDTPTHGVSQGSCWSCRATPWRVPRRTLVGPMMWPLLAAFWGGWEMDVWWMDVWSQYLIVLKLRYFVIIFWYPNWYEIFMNHDWNLLKDLNFRHRE